MNDQVEPADAARALSEIGRQREQAIRRAVIPGWYWWANAVLIVVLAAAVESGRGVVLGIGIAVFVAGSLAIERPALRALRGAPLHRSLNGPGAARRGLIGLAGYVAVLLGVLLATGLGLKAAEVPHPATIAAAVTAVLFAIGGQMLMRYENAVIMRRAGSRG